MDKKIERCSWVDSITMKYHDEEWCKPSYDDSYLFQMLMLESFQAGLSWVIILKKREGFRKAFDGFDYKKIANYSDEKVETLLQNSEIVRSRSKIMGIIGNAKIFQSIQKEFGSFSNYIWSFTENTVIKNGNEISHTHTDLSDKISKDLKKRGMKYMGTVTTYAYLQAIGVVDSHQPHCFLYSNNQ